MYPSYWDPCVGGVLAAGESFDDGAARELDEELGITAPLERLFPFKYEDAANVVHGMVYRTRHEGPFRLQPSELGKLVIIVVLAGLVVERVGQVGKPRFTLLCAGVVAVPIVIVFAQPDLGTAVLILSSGFFVLFLAGLSWKVMAGLAVAGTACLPIAW